MAYRYLSSWSTLVLAIIISSLVFCFISPRVYLTSVKAVLIILKHATLLRLSNLPSESALTQAELEYQEADIDSKICEQLRVSSQVQSIELFADFIMATDIGWSLKSLTILSHQAFSLISVFGWITCACKWCCLNSFCYNLDSVFPFQPSYCTCSPLFPLSIGFQLCTMHVTSFLCFILFYNLLLPLSHVCLSSLPWF